MSTKTNPTLIIGLGGTGRQTLMQVRRLFLEDDPYFAPVDDRQREAFRRQYTRGRVPHVELLSIDTDERLLDLDGEKFDPVLAAAALSGAEVLDIKIDPDKVDALYREPNAHPNYRDWYDLSLQNSGVPEHGCGQTRPWGRLAFFHNEGEIAGRVKAALERLLGVSARDAADKLGLKLENDTIKVQLVFSVAGGTGSGMFLDMAYLIRQLVSSFGSVTLVLEGVILLPTAFSNQPRHRVFANGYAALMEIEYFNRQREEGAHDGWFPVYWESAYDGRKAPRRISKPTFDIAWLIGNTSRGVSGTRPGARLQVDRTDKSAVTGMMAEWLYRRCSPVEPTFGGAINAYVIGNALPVECSAFARVNIYEGGDALKPEDSGFDFSRRYGSFGLSKLHAPSSLTQEKLAHRLVADMLSDWLQAPVLEAPVREGELQNARAQLNLLSEAEPLDAYDAPMDMQVYALSRSIDHASAGASLLDAVAEAVETDRAKISESEDFPKSFNEWRQGFRRQKVSDQEPNDARKGDFARNALDFARQRERTDAETLDRLLTAYLGREGRGIGVARDILESLSNDYEHVIEEVGNCRDTEAEAARTLDAEAADRLSFYEGSAFVRRTVAKVCFKKQREAFGAEIGRQIYERTLELATAMRKLVLRKIKELDALDMELRRLQKEVNSTAAQLEQRPHSLLNRLIVAERDDRYRTENEKDLHVPTNRWSLLSGSPAPNGPWPVREELSGVARARFRGDFIDFAKQRLDHVLRDQTDVLAVFDKDKTDDNEYQSALRPLVDNATSWAEIGHGARTWEANQPMGLNRTVARFGVGPRQDRLKEQLEEVGFTPVKELAGPPDQVMFEEHLTGYPLFEVANLRAFRDQAYEPMMAGILEGAGDYTNSALHLERDIDKYADLVLPDAQDAAARARAMGLFLRALMYGVIQGRNDRATGAIIFSYKKDRGLTKRDADLGPHTRVLRILARDRLPETQQIADETDRVETELWAVGASRRAEILGLLDYYASEESVHPLRSNRLFARITDQLVAQMKARADANSLNLAQTEIVPTLKNWSEEVPAGSGFRRLKL